MKTILKALIAVLLVLAIGIGIFVVLAATGNINFNGFTGIANLVNRQEISTVGVNTITVDYKSESVTLKKTYGNEIIIEEYMSQHTEDMLATINNAGGELTVRSGNRPVRIIGIWHAYAVVYVPDGWEGDLNLSTSSGSVRTEDSWQLNNASFSSKSGSVRVADIDAKGDITLTSSSGSVSAGSLEAMGNVALSSKSGSVKTDGVQAGGVIRAESTSASVTLQSAVAPKIYASSSSASVKVYHLEGEFQLESKSGGVTLENATGHGSAVSSSASVKVEMEELTGDLTCESKSGSVRLTLPAGTSFKFYAKTGSGSIKTGFNDLLAFTSNSKEATGSIGDTPEYTVTCTSSSGSVRVND